MFKWDGSRWVDSHFRASLIQYRVKDDKDRKWSQDWLPCARWEAGPSGDISPRAQAVVREERCCPMATLQSATLNVEAAQFDKADSFFCLSLWQLAVGPIVDRLAFLRWKLRQ